MRNLQNGVSSVRICEVYRMIVRPGEYDISNSEYHKHSAISSTGLKFFLTDCPARYEDMKKRTLGTEGIISDGLSFGSAWHTRILEPEKFETEVVEQPADMTRRGSLWKKFLRKNNSKYILRPGDTDIINAMAKAWDDPCHSMAKSLISGPGPVESSIFWQEHGVLCKIRTDKLRNDLNIAIDLKSTIGAGFGQFKKSIRTWDYDLSAVWYQRGLLRHYGEEYSFVWIAQEKTEPYRIAVYRMSYELFEQGLAKVEKALAKYSECMLNGEFPGYPNEIIDI